LCDKRGRGRVRSQRARRGDEGERSAWDTEARKIINVVGIRVVVDVFSLCVHARNPDGKPAQRVLEEPRLSRTDYFVNQTDRQRERESVCVCVRERERERESE